MPFESLSQRYEFILEGFPPEWLPLTYLYDPDLPLFPLLYFHELDPSLSEGERPGERDRIFGYVHHLNLENQKLRVSVAVNKDLQLAENERFRAVVLEVVKSRLGLTDPVRLADLETAFSGPLAITNALVKELWYQVVDGSFGKSLPFGALWDPVMGLARYIASFYSEGRKGEFIQTHYFASSFGVRIQTGSDIHADFYLLPTYQEYRDLSNPLSYFPAFSHLVAAAAKFCAAYCDKRAIGKQFFSCFKIAKAGGTKLDTELILACIGRASGRNRDALFEVYSAFNRGPLRTVIALMMLNDLRAGSWDPASFTPAESAELYSNLKGTYQTPKVIQLYSQQCFGATAVLPIDNWIKTFVEFPIGFSPSKKKLFYLELFSACNVWGKLERLIWIAVQARKVHSSVCSEILWCVRYGGPSQEMRGANPIACKICAMHIRNVCPAFAAIENLTVTFNAKPTNSSAYNLVTTARDNTTPAQSFVSCSGLGRHDEYSMRDRPDQFSLFPISGHDGESMTVSQFIARY